VEGVAAPSIDSVTETVQSLLRQADQAQLVQKLVSATTSFDRTARETEKLSVDGQRFLRDGRHLLSGLSAKLDQTDPILKNLQSASRNINAASADAAKASRSARNITGAIDNPRSLADLQATLANARRLTDQWEAVGGDVRKLTGDPKFIDGIRSVSVGLGKFFAELYPAQVDGAKKRASPPPRQDRPEDRMAPRSKAPALTPH
jgi:phospholipid/cholesterol/gamma-HCH transport system substrate-binding protein